MNWLDVAIIVVAVVLGFVGMKHGIIRTVFSIIGLVVGIVLAGRYYDGFANLFSSYEFAWAGIVAFAIILLATMALVGWIGSLISKLLKSLMLGWIDKLVGGILGLFLGAVFCAAFFTIVAKYFPGAGTYFVNSTMATLLMSKFPLLLGLLPSDFDFIRNLFQ
jgi:membrane protein required for colicin V production